MTHSANISVSVFLQFCKKKPNLCNVFCVLCIFWVFAIFFIFVITFEPNKIQTRLAPQNDRLILSFVNDSHVVGEKIT
jgi:hypothetical protein